MVEQKKLIFARTGETPQNTRFLRQPGSNPGFSTVFSTGVEILGNKPKPGLPA